MPHICIHELLERSPLPLVNLVECVNEELMAQGFRRMGVFGTRFTIESGFFGQLKEVELVSPGTDEIDYIHSTYFRLASQGRGTEEDKRGLTELAYAFCRREHLDGILLAGSDFSVIFNEQNTAFPHVDCALVHLRSIMNALLRRVR